MTLHSGPVMPRSVRYAVPLGRIRSSPVTTCVCVPTTTRHPTVEVQAQRVLLGRDLAVEVDQADRRQRLGRLVQQAVGVGERVLDLLHVGAALEVDHGQLVAVERVVHAPAAPRDLVGAVVERPQHPFARLEERVDLALVPDVVARRDDVNAGLEQRLGGRRREPHPAGDVLAVGGDEVDPPLVADPRQRLLDRDPPGLPDDVADHQDPGGAVRARRVAVGRIAQTCAVAARVHGRVLRGGRTHPA